MTKKSILFLIMLFAAAALAQTARVPVKNVAVIEAQIDERSGAVDDINRAEVGLITDEIRREAVTNLPRSRFNVMTSETVQSMGAAVLEECAEENCVIALGSKIGADYIVRGIISKFRDHFTVTIEMYETEYGMLVATASRVRTATLDNLPEQTAAACAVMYKTFLESSGAPPAPQPPAAPVQAAPTAPTAPRTVDDVMADGRKQTGPKPVINAAEPPAKTSLWLGLGLDAIGAGLIVYGIVQNGNVKSQMAEYNFTAARNTVKARNAAYTIGAAALLGGVSIHLFF